MEQFNEKELRKKLRREAFRKNWKLFKESKLGMVGLYIVVFFFILAILQPLLFITGIWNKGIYDPVVGYDSIKENLLVVDCPRASEYPTEKYESYLDCPGKGEINRKTILNQPTLKAGDYYEAFVQPAPPSSKHFLGTDSLGRDIFSQIMEGSQVAFVLGLLSATLGVGISTLLGTIAAFFGGKN